MGGFARPELILWRRCSIFVRDGLERFRMKPGEFIQVLARDRAGQHVFKEMKWGLVPPDFSGFPNEWHGNTSHARIETVAVLPSFAECWARKWRVLFPMAHYLQKASGKPDLFGGVKDVNVKIARSDGEPMAVAGIYSAIKRSSGLFLSCAMITRPASPGLEDVNDRFPAVLEKEEIRAWLDGSSDLDLAIPPPADVFALALAA